MFLSTSNNYSTRNIDIVKSNNDKKVKLGRGKQNGQIQIYRSPHRGSFSSVIRDSLRNAALGRNVLLVQFMKGGVKQGVSNKVNLCGNLNWVRPSHSFDQYESEDIINNKNLTQTIYNSINELWDFCKEELLSGENDQVILDEIFLALEMNIIDKDELISTLENRFITGDVILTGTSIPNNFLLMADQITELRS